MIAVMIVVAMGYIIVSRAIESPVMIAAFVEEVLEPI